MIKHDWFTITKINNKTYAISELGHWEKVHSFLLIGSDYAFLIDTGLGISSIKEITDQITTLPIKVITTHVHSDHIGNHHEFTDISVHKLEVEWLSNGIPGLSHQTIIDNLTRDITIPIPVEFDVNKFSLYKGQPTTILHDNDILDAGNRKIKILHTPGHSPGHVCILDLEYSFIFTGDLLYTETPIYAFYPSTSPKDLLNSLEKISKIENISMIYGSHNKLGIKPAIMNDVNKAIKYLRENKLDHFGTGVHSFNQISIKF